MDSTTLDTVVAATVSGLLLHVVYNRYEPRIQAFFLNLIGCVCIWAIFSQFLSSSYVKAVSHGLLFLTVHLIVLSASIASYRLFFHPLRHFSGPWKAKLTKWVDFWHTAPGKRHEWLSALHEKYGHIVRIGPNELSFSNPGSVKYLHGPQGARLRKGPYYDTKVWKTGNGSSMAGTRDWEDHRIRRRVWDHGFSQKALKSYEPRILGLLDELCEGLAAREGSVIDFSVWCDWFAFDTMGVLAFNEPFGLLKPDGPRTYSNFVRKGMQLYSTLSSVPWIAPMASYLPVPADVKEQAKAFAALGRAQYAKRRQQGTEPNDLFSHLIKGDPKTGPMREADLEADSPTIIIAGSDTSSITMTFLFFFINRDRDVYARLREEVDSLWDGNSLLEGNMLGPDTAPYLNGAINEALRIWPPGPNGMQRMTPAEGHVVDGVMIPGNTHVSSNTLALHRDADNFTEPLRFEPLRWNEKTRDPSWNHDIRAFIPFTGGTYSCAGRALALLELRLFTVRLVKRFAFDLAPGFDQEYFWTSVKSYQSLIKTHMDVVIKSREPAKV